MGGSLGENARLSNEEAGDIMEGVAAFEPCLTSSLTLMALSPKARISLDSPKRELILTSQTMSTFLCRVCPENKSFY